MAGGLFSLGRFRAAVRHFVVGRSAQAAFTLLITLATVRLLGGTDYGLYMIAWGLVELGVPLTSLGLLPAAQRFVPEFAEAGTPQRLTRFLRIVGLARWSLVAAACVALALAWPRMAGWMGAGDLSAASGLLVALLVASNLLSRFVAELQECVLDQKYAQASRATAPLLRLLGLGTLWWTGALSLAAVLWLDIAAATVAWLLGEYWLRRRLREVRPNGDFELSNRELWLFVWHMSGTQLLNAVANVGLLRLVVARTLGLELTGQFAFLQQLVVIGQRYLPSVLLANMIRPMLIARHAAGQARDVAVAFGLLWKLNFMLVWPAIPLMFLAGDPLVALASGGRVPHGGLPLALLLFGLAATAQNQIVVMAMQVYRYTGLARRISLSAMLAPVLAWAGAFQGLPGVSLGVAVALGLRGTIGIAALRRQTLTVTLDWAGAWRFLAALALSTGLAWATRLAAGPWAAAAVLLASSLLVVRLLRPISAGEFALLTRAVGRRARWLEPWSRP